MFKKLQFLILFLFISISSVFAGYVNSYNLIYSTTTETSTMSLKGDMYITSNVITGVPSSSVLELHSTGADKIILRDGYLRFTDSNAYLKFYDGSLQNSAGVGSAGNVSNNSDSIIVADADNDNIGDILFKIYNSTAALINNTSKNLISNYEIEAPTINVDFVQTKTVSGDLNISNKAGNIIAKMLDSQRFIANNLGQLVGTFTDNTTTDLVYSGQNESGFLILCRTSPGNTAHDYKLYFYAQSALSFTITHIITSQSLEMASLAFLSGSGSPNYEGTLRVTDTFSGGSGGLKAVYKIPIYSNKTYGI
jgi:hypothetical protein